MRGGKTFARFFKLRAKAEREARGHFIGTLALLTEEVERAAKTAAGGKLVDSPAKFEQAIADLRGQGFAQVGNMLVEFAARLDDELRRRGWRGSADIGDKISDGEVGFVADAGNYRNGGRGDGARYGFFVEGPQVFHGAAATREEEHIHEFLLVEKLQCFDDFSGGAFPLNAHGIERQMDVRKAPA